MNIDTGAIRELATLTDAMKKSGKWVPLPSHDENGRPIFLPGEVKIIPALNPASELPWDAKPQAHRRAIEAKRIARELLPTIPEMPRAGIIEAADLPDDERRKLLGIARP